ncbi:MAG: hypothetical protein QF485_08825 [Arenicellales bacterium]|nr:hypothetical protein [Arenicellales bacterium]MDP6949139.1 hypothetical protein [Arenicellales bacterium]
MPQFAWLRSHGWNYASVVWRYGRNTTSSTILGREDALFFAIVNISHNEMAQVLGNTVGREQIITMEPKD